jgi:uncharacterized RDD family membrane protein YckC
MDEGSPGKEQLKKRYFSLVVQQLQKGTPPESIIPKLLRVGFSQEEAGEIVNDALGQTGMSMPSAEPFQAAPPPVSPGTTAAPPPAPGIAMPPPPQAAAQDYATYAGFWVRFVAVFVDNIIISFITFPINFLLGIGSAFSSTNKMSMSASAMLFSMMVAIAIPWLYFALQEGGSKHATIGKRIFGLYVATSLGDEVTFVRASIRYWVSLVSGIMLAIGYIMGAFTPKKQTLHDLVADTVVFRIG